MKLEVCLPHMTLHGQLIRTGVHRHAGREHERRKNRN